MLLTASGDTFIDKALLQKGKYKIVRLIGSGGFGCTYEAEHVMLEKRMAIKELFVKDICCRDDISSYVFVGTSAGKPQFVKLKSDFIDEAKAICRFHHPGIVQVSDVFEENGTAYYVMDYIDGRSLQDIVASEGPLPEIRALKYIRQVADALQYAHSKDLLHLNVNPGNIMIDKNDNAVLIDFAFSPWYEYYEFSDCDPEAIPPSPVFSPQTVSPLTDIYSLGAVLYHLLTGRQPVDCCSRICGEQLRPLPANISRATVEAVSKAMELKMKDRPQTVGEFIRILDSRQDTRPHAQHAKEDTVFDSDIVATVVPEDETVIKIPPKRPQSSVKPVKKRSSGSKAGVVVLWTLIGVILGFVVLWLAVGGGRSSVSGEQDGNHAQDMMDFPLSSIAADSSDLQQESAIEPNIETEAEPVEAEPVESEQTEPEPEPEPAVPQQNEPVHEPSSVPEPVYIEPEPVREVAYGYENGYQWIDLGLSVKWATCNIGAYAPSDYGGFYAWGEIYTKAAYDKDNSVTYSKTVGDISGSRSRDAARANWGAGWRLPTQAEAEELLERCEWRWETVDGHSGYRVTGPNGGSIFLPASGYRFDTSLGYGDVNGYYWVSSPYGSNTERAYYIRFYRGYHNLYWGLRSQGRSIRPVLD